MISLILPYWDRQSAADLAMERLAELYADLDLEVIVIDDGNVIPFRNDPMPFPVTVIRLPVKTEPKSTGLLYNLGALEAKGEFLALSSIEMMHTKPVLETMAYEIMDRGPRTYISAAVWSSDDRRGKGRWHSHSSRSQNFELHGIRFPSDAALHFLTMMSRELWNAVGGFDPDYRDGAGFDDYDFLLRLKKHCVQFVIRDDLLVEHPRCRAAWKTDRTNRNRKLFLQKWAHVAR